MVQFHKAGFRLIRSVSQNQDVSSVTVDLTDSGDTDISNVVYTYIRLQTNVSTDGSLVYLSFQDENDNDINAFYRVGGVATTASYERSQQDVNTNIRTTIYGVGNDNRFTFATGGSCSNNVYLTNKRSTSPVSRTNGFIRTMANTTINRPYSAFTTFYLTEDKDPAKITVAPNNGNIRTSIFVYHMLSDGLV